MAASLAVSTQYTNVTDTPPDTARRQEPRYGAVARQKPRAPLKRGNYKRSVGFELIDISANDKVLHSVTGLFLLSFGLNIADA